MVIYSPKSYKSTRKFHILELDFSIEDTSKPTIQRNYKLCKNISTPFQKFKFPNQKIFRYDFKFSSPFIYSLFT